MSSAGLFCCSAMWPSGQNFIAKRRWGRERVLTYLVSGRDGCDGANSSRLLAARQCGRWWRAQHDERVRRIGVLQPFAKDSPESVRVAAFLQEMQRLGWTDGRNLQIEYRWETGDLQKAAIELVALSPEVILTLGSMKKRSDDVRSSR
jgi:hypothetical protein